MPRAAIFVVVGSLFAQPVDWRATTPWPLALEELDLDGAWQLAAVAQHDCVGIAAELLSPDETRQQAINLTLDAGMYHLLYAFDDVDNGTQDVSISDAFEVSR